jgi:hypothetical protein
MHGGGLGGHFRQDKTYTMIEQKFFWPKMRRDVCRFVKMYQICQESKGIVQNTGLYTPLPGSYSSLGGCKHGLCCGAAKKSTRNGFHFYGGCQVFKDGPFHLLQEDNGCIKYNKSLFSGDCMLAWSSKVNHIR